MTDESVPGLPESSEPGAVAPHDDDVEPRRSRLAVASAVLSLLSVVLLFPLLALVGAGVGVLALNRIKRTGARGFRWAVAGIAIGVVWFVLATVIVAVSGGPEAQAVTG